MHQNTCPSDKFCLRRELSDSSRSLKADPRASDLDSGPGKAMTMNVALAQDPGAIWVRRETDGDLEQRKALRRIRVSLAFMLEHLDRPLQVDALSLRAGVSPSHFHFLFRRATGYAPIDFLIRARMQRARLLLKETTLKVKEIAALLGYREQFYFSRQFRAVNRVTPSEYRCGLTRPAPVEPGVADANEEDSFSVRYLSVAEKIAGDSANPGAPSREAQSSALPNSRIFPIAQQVSIKKPCGSAR
jgi:AraC-like DNA-binding protein